MRKKLIALLLLFGSTAIAQNSIDIKPVDSDQLKVKTTYSTSKSKSKPKPKSKNSYDNHYDKKIGEFEDRMKANSKKYKKSLTRPYICSIFVLSILFMYWSS